MSQKMKRFLTLGDPEWLGVFSKSVRTGRFIGLPIFFWKKLKQRQHFRSSPYGETYYPADIFALLPSAMNATGRKETPSIGEACSNSVADFLPAPEGSVPLAGMSLPIVRQDIPFDSVLHDPEDTESLHRWNWCLSLLSRHGAGIAPWVTRQLRLWAKFFATENSGIHPSDDLQKSLRWESYTVGERVSNAVLFFQIASIPLPADLTGLLAGFIRFLLPRLEYRGELTGNHVINNARAVYLAGAALRVDPWRHFATAILKRELPKAVTDEGFLREGSSHYHFLFTRWLLEWYYFAEVAQDQESVAFLSRTLPKLLKRCLFFLVKENGTDKWDLPLIGDISPDFPPSWLMDLPTCPLAKFFLPARVELPPRSACNTWASVFSSLPVKELSGQERLRNGSEDIVPVSTGRFDASGWYRSDFGPWTLLLRANEMGVPEHVGHQHNDYYHFVLYHEGRPFLVDSGRRSYRNDDVWGPYGKSARAHNSFCIDGFGVVPERWNRYPSWYGQIPQKAEWKDSSDESRILLTSEGFSRLTSPVKVGRTLELKKESFALEDSFLGSGKRMIEHFFHWASGAGFEKCGEGRWKICLGKTKFSLILNGFKSQEKWVLGGEMPEGWAVKAYGVAEPTPALTFSAKVLLPASFGFQLVQEG
jgi:hypothetical protein